MGRSAWRRERRKRKFGLLPIITSISLFLVIASAILLFTDSFGFASSVRNMLAAGEVEEVDTGGVQVIDGDYTIDSPGEKLEDAHITGNLYLSKNIGEGNVDLVNVAVDGVVLIRGGGFNSIFMRDCIFNEVKVNRPGGRVRLVLSGETVVDSLDLETSARLVENLSQNGVGVKSVQVKTDDKVELAGEFEAIQILSREADVEIKSEQLNQLTVSATADGSKIAYPNGINIENLQLDGNAYLFGRGQFEQALLSASGTSELEGDFNRVKVRSEAGFFDLIEESTYDELVVDSGALNNVFKLYEDVNISLLELNEAVRVEGKGEIEKVIINAPGSTLEQIPHDIEFLQDVNVLIDGHEISTPEMLQALREHGDPDYVPTQTASAETTEPEPEPEPEQSSASAEEEAEPEEAEPEEAEPEAEKEDSEPKEDADADNGSLPGFSLKILSPSESGELLTQGKNLLYVTLDTEDPGKYRVVLEGKELSYLEEVKQFYGLVDKEAEESDFEGKIEITKIE